jgi:phenylalanyl-tRNA synthetase alpha chain
MQEKIQQLKRDFFSELSQAKAKEDIEQIRIKYLGRKGVLRDLLAGIAVLPAEKKPAAGVLANEFKNEITNSLNAKLREASSLVSEQKAAACFDVTMPGLLPALGHKHPLTQVSEEICRIFIRMGFEVVQGPQIETEYHNFQALNIPKDHPSRDTFDTFFLEVGPYKRKGVAYDWLLRSQTSTVQINQMQARRPPLKIVAPGGVFRPDATDASHSFMFNQIEGLFVDKIVTFAELKGSLALFAEQMFGADTKTRFRPHFFPFTEPSAEVDISCVICNGKGCRVCSQKGWLEVLGAGMVNPAVFEAVGYDPEKWTGFAFGMGVERLAMLKYGITDIRLFYENDLRFLRQF